MKLRFRHDYLRSKIVSSLSHVLVILKFMLPYLVDLGEWSRLFAMIGGLMRRTHGSGGEEACQYRLSEMN